MAMNLDTAIRLTAQVQGAQNLKGMSAQFQQLNATAQISGRQLDRLYTATQQFSRAAGGSINSLQQQRQALDTLRNAVDPASRRFQLLTRDIDNLDRRLQGLTRTSRTAGDGIRDQLLAGLATAGAGRLTAGVIGSAATFDQQVRTAAAIEGTAGSYDVLRREIERVAAAAAGTPTEVAKLSVALSRAGFTAQETTQALAGVVRGAEATGISFEEMGSIAADNLRSFGLDTTETARVVDVLVQAANSANQTVLDMGESMKYAAPISKSLGVSLEDTAATMALLANNGIRGSDAGTALRTGLTRLQIAAGGADSEIQNLTRGNALLARAMEALNADILDASGNLKPLDQVLIALRRNLVGLSTTDRSILAKALFGTEAGSKFLALINSTDNQINEMFGNLRNAQGIAEETQKKMQGFAYSLQVLRGNVEIVGNAIGDKFIVVLNPVVSGLNLIIGASQKLPKPLRDTAAAAGAAGVGIGGLVLSLKALGFLSTVSGALKTYAASTTAAGTASAVAAGKVTALGVALKGIAAIGIVTAGVSIVVNGINELNQARDQLKQARREAGLPIEDANAAQKAQAAATLAAIRKERESINRSNVLSKFIPGYEAFAPSAVRATRAKVLDEREKRARAIIEADLRPTPIPRPQPAAAAAGGLTTGGAAQSASEARKAADQQQKRNDALADHQRKTQEAIAQEQRQQNLQLFDNRMAMDRELFDLRMEQVRRQRDFDDRLRKAQYELVIQRAPEEQRPALRFAYEMEQIFKNVTDSLQGIDDELEKARRDLIDAQAGVRRAQMEQQARTITTGVSGGAAAGGAMMQGGIIARTGNTGQSTGPHLDARWADRRPITAADVDRYISVNGRAPSSFGVTSGYGPRNLFGRSFHAGVDFGTPSGSSISLKNGAQMLRDLGNTGAGGYAIEIMTAQGPMRLLHLQAGSAARTAAAPVAPVLPSPSAAAPGDLTTTLPASQTGVMAAQAEVERLQTRVRALERMRSEVAPQETRLAGITGQTLSLQRLEDVNKAFQNFAKATGDRLAYEREYAGLLANDVSPELAREFIELNRITAERSKQLQFQKEFYENQLKNNNITDAQKNIARQGLETVNQQLMLQKQQVEQVREELRLREQIIEAQRYRRDDRIGRGAIEGVRSYVAEIGTMREATAQLTQQGIRGLEDSMVSLATTGKANWREFTASVLEGTARMIIQQMVLAPLLRAIGGIGGSGIAQSFQMPPQYFLPAGGFSFEGGGYTGSGARSGGMDGRGGFLAMLHPRETVIDHTKPNAAGGNTTVVVNINTTTGETQTQATDADRRRLGQDIAQVVDARLVYHKRQGGMLSGRR